MSISLENVTVVSMGESIVTDVSLTVERGSINVLLGPTLAGKTTLMRLMAGLDRPTGGRILVDGKDATGVPVRERSVAMVYQQFMNYPSLTVYENIASPLRVARLKGDEIDRRVRRAAGVLGLEPLLGRLPHQLSGGQQQRTAIARAIVKNADLVLFDEPLANLDYKLREELREELPSILREAGIDFGLCDNRAARSIVAGRAHRDALAGARRSVRADAAGLSRAEQHRLGASFFRSPAQRNYGHQAGRFSSSRPGSRRSRCRRYCGDPDGVYRVGFRGDLARIGTAWPVLHQPSPAASPWPRSAARRPLSMSRPGSALSSAWSAA